MRSITQKSPFISSECSQTKSDKWLSFLIPFFWRRGFSAPFTYKHINGCDVPNPETSPETGEKSRELNHQRCDPQITL